MNKIRAIQELNKREIENGISPEGSWHVDYRDTAFIYFGGLPYSLTEGDIITVFSQFGEPVFLKLARDKETGKSMGFGWLKYEDQRSTDLAVDNLGGADISGRIISVDHARYKARDDEDPKEFDVSWEAMMRREGKLKDEDSEEEQETRPMLPEESELAMLIRDHDDDDPMKGFLVDEKKREVEEARRRADTKERHGDKHRQRRKRRDQSPESRNKRHGKSGTDRESRRQRGDSRDGERRHRRNRDQDSDKRRDRRDRDDEERERRRDRELYRSRHDRNRSQERHNGQGDDERRRRRSRSPRRRQD
ncbi:U2 snRNP component IST3 [Metarhizium album ARSEF 1941]|uniref:U2 snRNP component IST3 n=1 Tax=Metarhizium album (strain ARSEF 1941) TaxID=1081103 RepID=A0A0B2X6I6_METAS|nr:U2 snRNP component IST3 [Metarhizium album ARSEF 1941]KHO01358.1 U2 snRNP component IST3 [Metarhizium album ARSEF 1941]